MSAGEIAAVIIICLCGLVALVCLIAMMLIGVDE